jgi:diguanylate cyclase (GGDEF)-like protein
MLDIDRFKNFNDTYGHDIGDAVLRHTARVLNETTRAGERACRWGGEEFLVLCPATPLIEAVKAADRLRQGVESNRLPYFESELSITVSVGAAERIAATGSAEELLKNADSALYAAKRTGRNRVCTTADVAALDAESVPATCPTL